jgi:hypothetical protein
MIHDSELVYCHIPLFHRYAFLSLGGYLLQKREQELPLFRHVVTINHRHLTDAFPFPIWHDSIQSPFAWFRIP